MKTMKLWAVLALTMFLAQPAVATDGWWDDLYEEKTVTLEQILANPQAYKGMDVSFVIQFHQLGQIDNPYYTRFEKEQFVNFAAWSDTAALWNKKAFEKDFPYLFIDRIAKESQIILTAQSYDRFLVTGRVSSVFRGKPWIEVVGLKSLEKKMTEPTLIKMVKGYKLKKAKRYDAAATEFSRAAGKHLPESVQTVLNKEAGVCYAAARRYRDALVPLTTAVAMSPKDKDLQKVLAHCRAEVKKLGPLVKPDAKEGEVKLTSAPKKNDAEKK